MDFILKNWIIYYTKEVVKIVKVITIGVGIILTVACIKYKPVYKVTMSGETIGYITNRELLETKIEKFINDKSGNIAFKDIAELPSYEFKLVDKSIESDIDSSNKIMLAVKDATTTTYKFFAITSDGEQKAVVASQDEANQVIEETKQGLNENVDLKLGIVDVYTTENKMDSKEFAQTTLTELKDAKTKEYEEKKAEEERAKRAAALKAQAKSFAMAQSTTTSVGASGAINGMSLQIPVGGSISSRFGARGSRSSTHTGLDIATPSGTGVRPIAGGTVVFAGYKGSYGNLIIVDHGNGVSSYYAHLSAIYVGAGSGVSTGSTIGAVGSTGNSTGPHLHLEIRINGSPVNPQNYLY